MLQGGFTSIIGSSYTAEDENITAVNSDYSALEIGLRQQIDNIPRDYPGYDEYRYFVDEIGHDPFELASYLTAKYHDYTREEVQAELQTLFLQQYTLTIQEVVEVRYRTETRTDIWTDDEGNTHSDTYTVEVPYNIPYLFIFWCCLKLGTAYRITAGAGFGEKLIGMIKTIGPAFGTIAPGFVGADWMIGIVGAVVIRLVVYYKVKNAKKFRRDVEYGSARWGTEKDIKPFVDPVFKNNVILTGTEFLTMNTRPKNPANARNLNACVIGSSGSGKTRFWLTPQLLQAHSSFVVVDPKGGYLGTGRLLSGKTGL